MPITATYVSATSFSVAADKAAEFVAGVRVKADCGVDGLKYGTVTSAGTATVVVVLDSGSFTSNLTTVLHGNDVPASLCHHGHTGAADGGLIEIENILTYDELVLSMAGLYGYWPMNDVQADLVVKDIGPGEHDGASNLSTYVMTRYKNIVPTGAGRAIQLGTTSSDYVGIPIPSLISGFTVSIWHFASSISSAYCQPFGIDSNYVGNAPFLTCKRTNQGSPVTTEASVWSDDGSLTDVITPNLVSSLSSGLLVHYVVSFDGSTVCYYQNGQKIGVGNSLVNKSFNNKSVLSVGVGYWAHVRSDPCPGFYNGLALFTRAITDNEALQLYQSGVGGGIKGDTGDAVEWASTAETQAGTLTNKAVTPAGAALTYVKADCSVPFTGGHIPASGAYTGFKFTETGAATNAGKWIYQVDANQASLLAVNDAETEFNTVWLADRTGATPTAFTITPWVSLTGGGSLGADFSCEDFKVERPCLQDWSEVVNARGSISGAQTIDLELGNVVTATITAATTFTFSNPPATGRAGGFVLVLTNGGAGVVTWPTSVKWAGGTAPTLTASGTDIISFISKDAGTLWYGIVSGKDVK